MVLFPSFYVIRPSSALTKIAVSDRELAAFSEATLWRSHNPGDHDYEGQRAEGEAFLKLTFLAHVHRTLAEGQGTPEARATKIASLHPLLGPVPYTVETFDRFWTLDYAGVFLRDEVRVRRDLPAASVRAVSPPRRADGVGGRFIRVLRPLEEQWEAELAGDVAWTSVAAVALRAAIAWARDVRQIRRVELRVCGARCSEALLTQTTVPDVAWLAERATPDGSTAFVDLLGIDANNRVARVEISSSPDGRDTVVDRLFFELSYEGPAARIARGWLERTIRESLTTERVSRLH